MAAVTPSGGREGILFGACYVPGVGFPDGSAVKTLPGLGRSSGEGNGNPLRYLAWRISWKEEPGTL